MPNPPPDIQMDEGRTRCMNQPHWTWRSLLPVPRRVAHGHLRYVALASALTAVVLISNTIHVAFLSPSWWMTAGVFIFGMWTAVLNWRKMPHSTGVAFCVATDGLVLSLLWLNPGHSELGILFILVSAFASLLYHGSVVMLHLGLVAAALTTHVLMGGDGPTGGFVAVSVVVISVLVRVVSSALTEQVTRTETMQSLLELLPVLKAHGVSEVVRVAVDHLVTGTASESGIIMLLDPQRQVLYPYYTRFVKPIPAEEEEAMVSVEVPVGIGLSGWVALHCEPLVSGDAARDPRGWHVPGTSTVDESLMVVPLMTNGNLYGVLRLNRDGLHQYKRTDLDLLELMAAHVSDALSRAEIEERMSRTDALTGVYNRRYLNEWSQLLKPSQQLVSVLMIDLRRFKEVNDRWGHLAGDRILQEAARLIAESVRAQDLVIRYGGDEFLVILKGAGLDHATHVAQRLNGKIADFNAQQPPDSPAITVDIGVDCACQAEWADLLGRADARMYASKRAS